MTTDSPAAFCIVCRLVIGPQMEAFCNQCNQPYHLRQRDDMVADDCGQVWINEEHLALEFACDTCLREAEGGGGLDDVLDSGEAALAAGIAEDELLRAASLGTVRSRTTSSGVVLFERGDVLAFARERR